MKKRNQFVLFLVSFLFINGCGYGLYFIQDDDKEKTKSIVKEESIQPGDASSQYYYSAHPENSIILTHADIKKKKAYICNVRRTLMNFCTLARDTSSRKDELYVKELGREANNYVKIYVEPIFNDPEAVENLETKAEVVKLHLLSAALYFDLEGYYQSKFYLERLTDHYDSAYLSSITINQMDLGASTIAEGVENLRKNIALKQTNSTNNM